MYNDKSIAFKVSSIKYTSKEIYFRDVYLFLKYARDVVNIKNDELIYINLWIYLKDFTLE